MKKMKVDSAPVVVRGVHKYYGEFHAVKGISFHVKNGDCFGLLGSLFWPFTLSFVSEMQVC